MFVTKLRFFMETAASWWYFGAIPCFISRKWFSLMLAVMRVCVCTLKNSLSQGQWNNFLQESETFIFFNYRHLLTERKLIVPFLNINVFINILSYLITIWIYRPNILLNSGYKFHIDDAFVLDYIQTLGIIIKSFVLISGETR